ncbi:hypothetical protein [Pleionea sp. CnH1-48]|uniref:hypothetical protein n=1 Tax=Pleionea sp. CnH1-48 TaxID=2954494 RepID=UPI002096E846|nr:hypothetical protein [Pleionea sp. CnH1-48]MCO7223748.1 hypothetical protein [Pleionea sp. CnH1-48]
MTQQASDVVIWKDRSFFICGTDGGSLFSPTKHGYDPMPASTACGAGYWVEYKVETSSDKEQLYLQTLIINDSDGIQPRMPKPFAGIEPEESRVDAIGPWAFNNMNYPLDFTGELFIGQDSVDCFEFAIGAHCAYGYKTAYQLSFDKGVLQDVKDISRAMEEERRLLESGEHPALEIKPLVIEPVNMELEIPDVKVEWKEDL